MAFDLSMPILVVDDYSTMIRIIRNLLKQIGFENVDDASDGSAALAKMQGKRYGLVISDWNMEPMTGYDLLKEVRASPEFSQDALHHDHGGIEDRKRHRREEGRRQQLHRQAVQRGDAEDQDGSGVSRRRPNSIRRTRPRSIRAYAGCHPAPPSAQAPSANAEATSFKLSGRGTRAPHAAARWPYFYGLRFSQTDNVESR